MRALLMRVPADRNDWVQVTLIGKTFPEKMTPEWGLLSHLSFCLTSLTPGGLVMTSEREEPASQPWELTFGECSRAGRRGPITFRSLC